MLDMGFINDVDEILRHTPMSRQTMLLSATIPEAIRRLSQRYMFHPEIVRIGGHRTRVKDTVEHALYPVRSAQKTDLLLAILDRDRPSKALIFTATRETTSSLALSLRRAGHEVVSLSSLLSQANRERALGAFRRGEFDILVATDVAARGLDITDIDLVVNFDVPMHPEDYVHRIGRTGRAERSGRAVTLVTELDRRRVADIERLLRAEIERKTVEGFSYDSIPAGGDPRRRGGKAGRRRSSAAVRSRSTRSRKASGPGRRRRRDTGGGSGSSKK
jgi:ATP-dependent RNA helicase RhlE